ncbi:hypothetical protein [Paenibacillus marinisediminis]
MKKAVTVAIVVIITVTAGWLVKELLSGGPPSPTIQAGKVKVAVLQGSYCWTEMFRSECADMASPPMMVKHEGVKPVVVSPEAQLTISFGNKPNEDTLGANIWLGENGPKQANLNRNVLTAPKEKGVYIYDIHAGWNKGGSSYVFVIEVQ